jgi:hypothetical protein
VIDNKNQRLKLLIASLIVRKQLSSLVTLFVSLIFLASQLTVGVTVTQAASDIYFFHTNVSPAYSHNMSHIMSPNMITLGVGKDLDTLDIAVDFADDLTQNSFVGYQLFNEANTEFGFEVPQLRISLVPSSGSIFGISQGTINFATNISPYFLGVEQTNTSWAGPGTFAPPNNNLKLGNCAVTSRWTSSNQMDFSILRSCTQLPPQFSIMAEVVHLSPTTRAVQSVTSTQYPGLIVDLMKVPGFKLDQRISAQSPQNVYVTQGSTQISASSSAQLPLSFSVPITQNICEIADSSLPKVMVKSAGQCDVLIAALGNDKYQSASTVQVSFQVLPALSQTITHNLPAHISLDSPQISFQANSSSGSEVIVASGNLNICEVLSGRFVLAKSPGVCHIALSAARYGPYEAAQTSVDIEVSPQLLEQKVYFVTPKQVQVGDSFELDLKNDAAQPLVVATETPGICNFQDSNRPLLVSTFAEGTCAFTVQARGNEKFLSFSAENVNFEILPIPVPDSSGDSSTETCSDGFMADGTTCEAPTPESTPTPKPTPTPTPKPTPKPTPTPTPKPTQTPTPKPTQTPTPKPTPKPTPTPKSKPTPTPTRKIQILKVVSERGTSNGHVSGVQNCNIVAGGRCKTTPTPSPTPTKSKPK